MKHEVPCQDPDLKLAPLAMERAVQHACQQARITQTHLAIWLKGRVEYVTPEQFEQLQKHALTKRIS